MWPRIAELILGAWLVISPLLLHRTPGDGPIRLAAVISGLTLVLVSALNLWLRRDWLRGLVGGVAIGLGVLAWTFQPRPGPPAAQNGIVVSLILLTLCLLPNHASQPPKRHRVHGTAFRLIPLLLLVLAGQCRAQPEERGVGLAGGHVSGVFGGGAQPGYGLSFAVATAREWVVQGEISGISDGSDLLRESTLTGIRRRNTLDLNGSAQFRFGFSRRNAPYVAFGAGLLRTSSEIRATDAFGNPFTSSAAENDFALHAAVGTRYYLTDHWGVKPEARFYFSRRKLGRIGIGIFYQFP